MLRRITTPTVIAKATSQSRNGLFRPVIAALSSAPP
jgi:hypothetical protein